MTLPKVDAFYAPDAFRALADHYAQCPDLSSNEFSAWGDAQSLHEAALGRAIMDYLNARQGAEPLSKAPYADERRHRLAIAWNAFVDGSIDEWGQQSLRALLGNVAFNQVVVLRGEGHESQWLKLRGFIERGDIEWYDAAGALESPCAATGARVYLQFNRWTPQLGTVDHAARSGFVPLEEPLPPKSVSHHVIQAPSGELLVADWFRIEAFTKAVSSVERHGLDSERGRVDMASNYATQHGFMSVMVGNTVPMIVERSGHTIVARLDEDSGPCDGQILGRVCTDLWWATAIDREVLVALVAKTVPIDEARRLVDAEVEPRIRSGDVTVLQVPKGLLHVYHTGTPSDMSLFECDQVSTRHVEQLYAVVSPNELKWTPKGESKPQRRARMR